jgi:hypothetical protein
MSRRRKAVPAALHSELSEYASLVRALRTSDISDLSSQLTRLIPVQESLESLQDANSQDTSSGNEFDGYVPRDGSPPQPPLSRTGTPSEKPEFEEGSSNPPANERGRVKSKGAHQSSDIWTRWPLLPGDVPIPEWSFEDEVHVVASRALMEQKSLGDHENDEEPLFDDEPSPGIAFAASEHLSQILGALAAHVPTTELSMHERLAPLGWESVLAIVSAHGLATPE